MIFAAAATNLSPLLTTVGFGGLVGRQQHERYHKVADYSPGKQNYVCNKIVL